MQRIQFRYAFGLVVVALILLAAACQSTRSDINGVAIWPRTQAQEISRAAGYLGVQVETENMVSVSQGGATLSTATIRSWRSTPATELPNGVNYAVAYLNSPGQRFPAGYYTLRAFANPHGVGQVEGRVQVIDATGRTVNEVPATIDISSMTVPPGADRFAPTIGIVGIPIAPQPNGPYCRWGNKICHCCGNGQLVCTGGLWEPNFSTAVAATP